MGCTKETDLNDLKVCNPWEMHRAQRNQDHTGDPVNVVTGAFTLTETDAIWPCQRLPITLTRTYDSQVHQAGTSGAFGPGWTHSLALRLEQAESKAVDYIDDRHARLRFEHVAGRFQAPVGAQGMLLEQVEGGWVLRQLDGLTAKFDPNGRLTSLSRPGPRADSTLTLSWTNGAMTRVEGLTGALVLRTESGRIVEVSDPMGRRWQYRYDQAGYLSAVIRPSGVVHRYAYSSIDQAVTVVTDDQPELVTRRVVGLRTVFAPAFPAESGAPSVTNTYTSDGRVGLQEDAVGGRTRFSYNLFTRMTAVTDPEGWTCVHSYDKAGNTVRVVTPEGRITEYVHDEKKNLLATIVDGAKTEFVTFKDSAWHDRVPEFGRRPTANRSDYLCFTAADLDEAYDENGNAPLERDAVGNIARYSNYSQFGQPGVVTRPDGVELHTSFNERSGLPCRRDVRRGGGTDRSTRWTHDDFGNVVREEEWTSERLVSVRQFDYDSTGTRCRRAETSIGTESYTQRIVELYEYDEGGRLSNKHVQTIAANGVGSALLTTSYEYDLDDQLVMEADDSLRRRFDRDASGRIVVVGTFDLDDRLLSEETSLYDAAGRCVEHRSVAGGVTRFTFDACARLTQKALPDGSIVSWTYDRDGRVVAESTPSGHVDTMYDGRVVRSQDQLGTTIEIERDPIGRVTAVHRDGAVTKWTYHQDHTELLRTDGSWLRVGRGPTEITERGETPHIRIERRVDGMGRPTALHVCDKRRRGWLWDDERCQRIEIEPDGTRVAVSVDAAGLVIQRRRADSVMNYDRDARGRLTRWRSADGSVDCRYTYGRNDELASVTSYRYEERWEHDMSGRPTRHQQIADAEASDVRLTWDTAGRLTSATDDKGWFLRIDTHDNGHVRRVQLPGRKLEMRRDSASRHTTWDDGTESAVEYRRGGLDAWFRQRGGGTWRWSIERDALARVTSEMCEEPDGRQSVVAYVYDAADRLCAVKDDFGRELQAWEWDDLGNLTQERRDGTVIAEWTVDGNDRIQECTIDGRREPIEYDDQGRLVRAGRFSASYDDAGHPRSLNELSDIACCSDGAITAWTRQGRREVVTRCLADPIALPDGTRLWWLDGVLIAYSTDGVARPVITDPRGSVVAADGLASMTRYDAWGVGNPIPGLPIGFEGKLSIDGVYDNRARLYLPAFARFAQPDPSGVGDDPNVYLYAHANPLTWSDANGRTAIRSGHGCVAHMPTIDLMPLVSVEAFRAAGIQVATTYIAGPQWLDFDRRAHYVHRDKAGDIVGTTRVYGPGWFETRPHFVHYDLKGDTLGRSYIEGPGLWETAFGLIDKAPHVVTYDTKFDKLGTVWVEYPTGLTGFVDQLAATYHPHLTSYDMGYEKTGTSRLIPPGWFETRPHLVHSTYDRAR